jgi:hypothetical protein
VWLAKLGGTDWDLAPDGEHVAVVTPAGTAEAPKQEHEVVNTPELLRRAAAQSAVGKTGV